MFRQVELIAVGFATVVDVVLLSALVERRNRARAALPVSLLVAGATMLHGGAFVRLLLMDMRGVWAEQVHWAALVVLTFGLLLIPAAMTHCCWRLWRTGFVFDPPPSRRYLAAYLPMVPLLPAALWIHDDPRDEYWGLMRPLIVPFAAWFVAVCFGSAVGFYWQQRRSTGRDRRFCRGMSLVQAISGGAFVALVAVASRVSAAERAPVQLAALLVPLLPVVVLGYFVIRYHFMQIMVERTVVYAAVLVAVSLFHHVAVLGLQNELADRYQIDFGIVEGLLIAAVVIAYQPLRSRAAEALRYLLGARADQVRRRMRDLGWQMSTSPAADSDELISWFRTSATEACGVEAVSVWLFDGNGRARSADGDGLLHDAQATELHQSLRQSGEQVATPWSIVGRLPDYDASLVVRFEQPATGGLVVFGRRRGNAEFSQEEVNAVVLLVEQFGIVLHNLSLQTERLLAERRAVQNEKLSTLGLLAGSIAHEIKNPLSSIKTLAAVMAEDLGPESPHAEDLRLILGEVDRLTTTTTQLLGFVRPAKSLPEGCAIRALLESTVGVMRHWAHERGVTICSSYDDGGVCVAADEGALREVIFNLLKNAVEAVDRNGCVTVRTRLTPQDEGRIVVEIHDDGPGLSPEVQDRLFEPFVTTKTSGTGLGLYLVGREVRAAGGRIECRSGPQQGTLFTITLPAAAVPAEAP